MFDRTSSKILIIDMIKLKFYIRLKLLKYSACWPDEVLGISMIDFAMKDCNIDNRDNLGDCWRDGKK